MEAKDFINDLLKEKDAAYAIYDEKLKQISKQMMNHVFISTTFKEEPGEQQSPLEGKILILPESFNSINEKILPLKLLISFKFSTLGFSHQDSEIKFVKPCKVELSAFLQKYDHTQLMQDISHWENIQKFPISNFKNIEEIVFNCLSISSIKKEATNWNFIAKSKPRLSGMAFNEKEVLLHDSFLKATSQRMVQLWDKEKIRFLNDLSQFEQQILALHLHSTLSDSKQSEKKFKL